MKTNRPLTFLVLLGILLFTACKKQPQQTRSITNKLGIKETRGFGYLNARGKVSYKGPDRSFSSSMRLRMREDSVIWMSFAPMLGIEAVRCMFTPDSAYIMNRLKNKYYRYSYTYFKRKYQMDLTFEGLQALLLGNFYNHAQSPIRTERSNGQLTVKQQAGRLSIQNIVDLQNDKIKQVLVNQQNSANAMTVDYKAFEKAGPYQIPRNNIYSVQHEKDEETLTNEITIKLSSIDFPDNALSFPFSVPDKYERVGGR